MYQADEYTVLEMRVRSTYRLGGSDPTVHLRGSLWAVNTNPEGESLLAEVHARRFIPHRLEAEMDVGDRELDLFELHDNHDQDTHELWTAIYNSENGIDFSSTWTDEAAVDLEHTFGDVILIEPVKTRLLFDNDWLEVVTLQAFLDDVEKDVGMTLVDMRSDSRDLTPEGRTLSRARVEFGTLGFAPRVHTFEGGDSIEFLFRCPQKVQPRAKLDIDEFSIVSLKERIEQNMRTRSIE